jgi:hypothetical protein
VSEPSPPSGATPSAPGRRAAGLALGDDGYGLGASVRKVPTGILGFDHVAMGGLPAQRATVVAGQAGSAKTLFAAQFLAEGVRAGQPGVFVTLEEPARTPSGRTCARWGGTSRPGRPRATGASSTPPPSCARAPRTGLGTTWRRSPRRSAAQST